MFAASKQHLGKYDLWQNLESWLTRVTDLELFYDNVMSISLKWLYDETTTTTSEPSSQIRKYVDNIVNITRNIHYNQIKWHNSPVRPSIHSYSVNINMNVYLRSIQQSYACNKYCVASSC